MLDAARKIAARDRVRARDDVEHLAVGAVADRVDGGREPVFEAAPDVALEILGGLQREAGVGRALARFEHPRRHRSERAVGEELHAADAQHVVAVAGREVALDPLVEHAGAT